MKRLLRKIRRFLKRFPTTELVLLLTISQLLFPQHTVAVGVRGVVAEPIAYPEAGAYHPELGQLPELPEAEVRRTILLTVTAYSSTTDQTDGDPFTAASGATVFDGMIAYNFLPFGTKVRFPEYFGEKVFVVLDRMNERKGRYIADIWMETREQANAWGARITTMEILE